MANIFIVLIILACFIWWEILFLLAWVFLPRKKALACGRHFEDKAISLIFTLFRTYRGFDISFENKVEQALPRRYLLVSNHQSLLDIVAIMRTSPGGRRARFVAKHELGWGIPLISLLLRKMGHALVRRHGDARQAMVAISAMSERCKREGTIPVIFPEGTRSRTGKMGEFHSAGYRKILEIDPLPILVVAIDGGWKVGKMKDFFLRFGKFTYKMRYITLLRAPEGKKEALASLEAASALIRNALEEMRS